MPEVRVSDRYIRIGLRSPEEFVPSSFRTHDIGRPGHSKRIAGILKSTGEWATQAWLINKEDFLRGDPKTLKLLWDIEKRYPWIKAQLSKIM